MSDTLRLLVVLPLLTAACEGGGASIAPSNLTLTLSPPASTLVFRASPIFIR